VDDAFDELEGVPPIAIWVVERVIQLAVRAQVAEAADIFVRPIPPGDEAGVNKSVSQEGRCQAVERPLTRARSEVGLRVWS
jgi:hypothetical protein